MPRIALTEGLKELHADVLNIGSMVEKAIQRSVEALRTRDASIARRVIAEDAQINALRFQIEENALTLIAMQQPLVHDLRTIAAVLQYYYRSRPTGCTSWTCRRTARTPWSRARPAPGSPSCCRRSSPSLSAREPAGRAHLRAHRLQGRLRLPGLRAAAAHGRLVTDLDAHLTVRALDSLAAELNGARSCCCTRAPRTSTTLEHQRPGPS